MNVSTKFPLDRARAFALTPHYIYTNYSITDDLLNDAAAESKIALRTATTQSIDFEAFTRQKGKSESN